MAVNLGGTVKDASFAPMWVKAFFNSLLNRAVVAVILSDSDPELNKAKLGGALISHEERLVWYPSGTFLSPQDDTTYV